MVLEAAFCHFGGIPAEVLIDNVRALVAHHDTTTREVTFNARFHAFARYWGFKPRACAPYRARTKGKDERGVGYVKRNAVAALPRGSSWRPILPGGCARSAGPWHHRRAADRALLSRRGEGSAGDRRPAAVPPSTCCDAAGDGCIDLDTNHYSVPWPLIGALATVEVSDGMVRISHAGSVLASHSVRRGWRERAVDTAHLAGIVADRATQAGGAGSSPPAPAAPVANELLRPLSEYEGVAGGGW